MRMKKEKILRILQLNSICTTLHHAEHAFHSLRQVSIVNSVLLGGPVVVQGTMGATAKIVSN